MVKAEAGVVTHTHTRSVDLGCGCKRSRQNAAALNPPETAGNQRTPSTGSLREDKHTDNYLGASPQHLADNRHSSTKASFFFLNQPGSGTGRLLISADVHPCPQNPFIKKKIY